MKYLVLLIMMPFIVFSNPILLWENETNQGIRAKFIQENDEISLNDNLVLTIDITAPASYEVEPISLQTASEDDTHGFRVISEDSHQTTENAFTHHHIQLQLEPLESGEIFISAPPIKVTSLDKNEDTIILYPDIFSVTVENGSQPSEAITPLGLLPIKDEPIYELSRSSREKLHEETGLNLSEHSYQALIKKRSLFKQILIICTLFVIGFIAIKYILKRCKKQSSYINKSIDPKVKALQALQKLTDANLPEKGRFETFYTEITLIVRQFIEDQYLIKAPEQTTQEFLREVAANPLFSTINQNYLDNFLNFADLVKFARLSPKKEDCEQARKSAFTFIEEA